jgi:hypothetical protein
MKKVIITETQKYVRDLAEKNGWLWFYQIHLKPMAESAEFLADKYPEADKEVAVLASWFHDISKIFAHDQDEFNELHKNHHIDSAKVAEDFLSEHGYPEDKIEMVKECVARHRNAAPYEVRTIEEKIVACADALGEFKSIFFLTFFKFHPEVSMEDFVERQKGKIDRGWRDISLLPEAQEAAKKEYEVLNEMLASFEK